MDTNLRKRNKALLATLLGLSIVFYIVAFVRYPGLN